MKTIYGLMVMAEDYSEHAVPRRVFNAGDGDVG